MTKRLRHILILMSATIACVLVCVPGRLRIYKAKSRRVQAASCAREGVLRVCADPNNLPFSNDRMEGFENKLAPLIANQMNARLEYTWWAERKNFIKNSLLSCNCDLIMGVPSDAAGVWTSPPYYRSGYVFVYRKNAGYRINSLDDPILRKLRIGVHVVDSGYAPPADALAKRGVVANITGFSLFGKTGDQNPPARLIEAVAKGEIDVALAWGPLAGFYAYQQSTPLVVIPIPLDKSPGAIPLTYAISMATRKDDTITRAAVLRAMADSNKKDEITKILAGYRIPTAYWTKPDRVNQFALTGAVR